MKIGREHRKQCLVGSPGKETVSFTVGTKHLKEQLCVYSKVIASLWGEPFDRDDAREFLFLRRRYVCPRKKTRHDASLFTANTAKNAFTVLPNDTKIHSVSYGKVGMSHLLMFKIHQDLQVDWDSWQMTLKQNSSTMWYFSITRKKRHFWQLRNGDQTLKVLWGFFALKEIWNMKLMTEIMSLPGSLKA